jgi:ParB family chromosome partitioning protein
MAKKGGLGKGLDALIPGDDFSVSITPAEMYVPISMIVPNPRQPRAAMNEEDLEDLANSIREHGIIQPLIVTLESHTGIYTLIAGERRLRASQLIGLEKVPVIVRTANDQERLELALIENVQRADLSPLETAAAYHKLANEFNLSHEVIATRVGKSRVSVTNTLRLLLLPEKVKTALSTGEISEGHARALLGLPTEQAQTAALQTVVSNTLNVRQTEELVRKLTGNKPPAKPEKQSDPATKELEEQLRAKLGTKVTLKHGEHGGTLTIHYYSNEELTQITDNILKG